MKKLLLLLVFLPTFANAAVLSTTFLSNNTSQTVSFASTTQLSAGSLCLNTCITAWPISGGSGIGTISTSTNPTIGQLAYFTSTAYPTLLGSIGTTSGTVSAPLTGNFICLGSGCTLGIQASSASQAGSLAAVDWQLLHAATTTFSSPLTYTSSTNAVTCTTCIVSIADLTATNATLTFSGIYNGSSARTIGLNLGQANNWTAQQTFGSTFTGVGTTSPVAALAIVSQATTTNTLLSVASTTSSNAATPVFAIYKNGHIVLSGPKPQITTTAPCGTSPSITGNDAAGKITTGTAAPLSCSITFANTYGTAPSCVITGSPPTGAGSQFASGTFISSTTATALNFMAVASTSQATANFIGMTSWVVSYHCFGIQ